MASNKQTTRLQQEHPHGGAPRSAGSVGDYFFMRSVLERISSGRFFKTAFSIVLKVLAALFALGGIVLWVRAWGLISELGLAGIVGGLFFQLVVLVVIYMVVHTMFIRAGNIASLPESGYAVIPISSIFFKMLGELYACINIPIAIAGGVFIWFAGDAVIFLLRDAIPFTPGFGGAGFLGGLLFMVGGVISSIFVLMFFYLISEVVHLGVDIAQNTGMTSRALGRVTPDSGRAAAQPNA